MKTAVRAVPLAGMLLLLAAAPAIHALPVPILPEAVSGEGTASRFYVESNGVSFEGGTHQRTIVCRACFIRVNLTDGQELFALQHGGVPDPLTPGTWEFRGYVGTFSYTMVGLGNFRIMMDGAGSIHFKG